MIKNALLFLFILTGISTHATIIAVDNNYPSMGNYSSLLAAHNAASPGDTLVVYPSFATYQAITLTKKLRIIGSGFDNTLTGVKRTCLTGTMSFETGSDGSSLTGFGKTATSIQFNVVVNANSITLERNLMTYLQVKSGHSGTTIIDNFFIFIQDGGTMNDYLVSISDTNEILFAGNIVKSVGGGNQKQCLLASGGSVTGVIANNIIVNSDFGWIHPANIAINADGSGCSIYNNIIGGGICYGNNYSYNITRLQTLSGLGNLLISDFSTVFVDFNNDDFHLKAGSPAADSGLGGTDRGIYGGDFPFVDGGAPPLPQIYYLDVPINGSPQGGLNVTIKARSNN